MVSSILQYPSSESNSSREEDEETQRSNNDPMAANLSLSIENFLKAAISVKEQVVEITWRRRVSNGILDPTVYTGLMGTAFTCLRCYEATGNYSDLVLCVEIVDVCAGFSRNVTFLCGGGGVYAVGAVAANYCGDEQKRDLYLERFLEMAQDRALPVGPEEGGLGMSYELLNGRAGFLFAALFINKHLKTQVIQDSLLLPIVKAIVSGGRAGASVNTACPLTYRWHGTSYWGAAHGLAGILHVLLHFPLSAPDREDVKATLKYMINNRFPNSGNYPVSEGNPRDKLVQWSHGAGGVSITLCKASQVFVEDREFRDAAIEAGEVVWKNGLAKKVGLADGTSGNGYAFLSLLRLTGESVYEERARAFARYLYANVGEIMREECCGVGDDQHRYSLFQGVAGVACLWFDLIKPEKARFPGYEV